MSNSIFVFNNRYQSFIQNSMVVHSLGRIDIKPAPHVARLSAAIELTLSDNKSLSSMRKYLNYHHHLSDEKW